jgi:hypothetical protein
MNALTLMRDYLVWHYTEGIVDLLYIWRNMLWAVGYMFSVKDVFFTLFSPFKRLQEQVKNPLVDFQGFLGSMLVNILMRLVGFIIRSALLFIALSAWAILIVSGAIFLMFWLALPYAVFVVFATTVSMLIS